MTSDIVSPVISNKCQNEIPMYWAFIIQTRVRLSVRSSDYRETSLLSHLPCLLFLLLLLRLPGLCQLPAASGWMQRRLKCTAHPDESLRIQGFSISNIEPGGAKARLSNMDHVGENLVGSSATGG